MPLGPLNDLPKEAWALFGVIATMLTTFVLGLLRIKTGQSTAQDASNDAARAELSSSQRDFIRALQDEMSLHHAKMADMDNAYKALRQALEDERQSCDLKMRALQAEIDDLKRRVFNEEHR